MKRLIAILLITSTQAWGISPIELVTRCTTQSTADVSFCMGYIDAVKDNPANKGRYAICKGDLDTDDYVRIIKVLVMTLAPSELATSQQHLKFNSPDFVMANLMNLYPCKNL